MTETGAIHKVTITQQVTEQLRKDVLLGAVQPGSRLTVRALCERYDVSPIPVREALRTLSGERLLTIDPYVGATVCNVDQRFVSDVYEINRSMEVLIVEKAMEHWDDALRREVIAVNDEIRLLDTQEKVMERYNGLNRQFHNALEQFCTNDRALDLFHSYHNIITILAENNRPHTVERIREAAREHDAIIVALDSGILNQLTVAYNLHTVNAKKEFLRQLYGE